MIISCGLTVIRRYLAKKSTSTIMDIDYFRPVERKPKLEVGYTYDELVAGGSALVLPPMPLPQQTEEDD